MPDAREGIRHAYASGNLEQAEELARTHLQHHQDDGRTWEWAGLIHFAMGRFPLAVSALERASAAVPLTGEGRVSLAQGYALIGKPELSCDLLALLISDEFLSAALLLHVARALNHLDEPVLAMHACRSATRRDPELAQAYYDMGFYGSRCGVQPHHIEALARKAISLAPDSARYRIGLASHLVQQGRMGDAYTAIRNLTNQQIDAITCECCLARLAGIYEEMGDASRLHRCRLNLGQTTSD